MTVPASSVVCLPTAWEARVRARLAQAEPQRLIERLWQRDASLWTDEPQAQELIHRRLGWLSILPVMTPRLPELRALAREAAGAGYTHAVLLGMGGSSLFADVCRGLFPPFDGGLALSVLDSTDPTLIRDIASRAPLEHTLFVVSSKSGTTLEVLSLFDYFYGRVRAIRGDQAGEQFVVVTDDATPLAQQALRRGARRLFAHGAGSGRDVGGRFSALTFFGLVPAALLGVDCSALLERAAAMEQACGPSARWGENSAAVVGLALAEAAAQGRNKLTLLGAPPLKPWLPWVEQLVAESTGKAGQGLLPILGESPDDAARAVDRLFLLVRCPGAEDPTLDRRVEALAEAGHPVIRLEWRDRYDVGGEVVRWSVATALLGAALRINPFDEPNVQDSKDRTTALLERYLKAGDWPLEPPVAPGARADAVRTLLSPFVAGDYVAILTYLPRTAELDAAVEAFRRRAAALTPAATSLGYGPRYLHSVGQLHKGGPPQAGFLFLTSDDPLDVPIPGQGYSFSVLKRAQALGDIQALQDRGRRVLRLHLGTGPLEALRHLTQQLA